MVQMDLRSLSMVLCAALALAGCSAVRRAREAQREVEDRAAGAVSEEKKRPSPGDTLADLVRYAVANRPTMTSARLAVDDARLALKEIDSNAPLASATPWNAFGANASGGYSASSASTHLKDLEGKTRGSWSGALSLDILLYDFGRHSANARAQSERVLAAELDLVDAGYSVFKQVASSYFARLQAAALLDVAFTNKQMRAEHLERAKARFEEGEAQQLDVTRAQLDLAEAHEDVVAASNQLVTASADLAASLGLETGWEDVLPGASTNVSFVRAFAPTARTTAELFDFARTNAPSMQVSRARLRAASAAVDAAIADMRPSLSASLSLNWADPLWYWRWGVSGVQSLFTGFRKTTAVDRATVALKSAAAAVDSAELDLSFALEQAVAERDNAREAFKSAKFSVRSARENLDTVVEQFSVGDASRIEYTDAVADFVSALANAERAFYRGQIAEATLFALIGVEPAYVEQVEDK